MVLGTSEHHKVMTAALVSRLCKEHGGFRTPELNEKLYLHFHGFSKIDGLSSFTACRVLWLENNLIEEVENLDALVALDSIYLQHNRLHSLGHTQLVSVTTLNVSYNRLTTLDGIENFPSLVKLHAAHNEIESIAPLLRSCASSLSVLDVSYNKFADSSEFLSSLAELPQLASLMSHGNPVVRAMPQYRKKIINANPQLKYLDEYPVFPDEARCVVAFFRGGIEAEKAERQLIRREEEERCEQQRQFFAGFVAASRNDGPRVTANTRYYETMREIQNNAPTGSGDVEDDDCDVYIPRVAVAYQGRTLCPSSTTGSSSSSPSKSQAREAAVHAAAVKRHLDPLSGLDATAQTASFLTEKAVLDTVMSGMDLADLSDALERLFS